MSFTARHRLVPGTDPVYEWTYLVNETLAGERCILPLLDDLHGEPLIPQAMRAVIRRQIAEETDHVERYERILAGQRYRSTGYDVEFATYVTGIKSVTLRLFVLQAILESISLGALEYRLASFPASPSRADDELIYRDEQGHVRFGYAFLKNLKVADPGVTERDFHEVAKGANAIFARHFNGAKIAQFFSDEFAKKSLCGTEINASDAMNSFRRTSLSSIAKAKREFIRRYFSHAESDHV